MTNNSSLNTSVTNGLTHFDAQGQAHMVDVAAKAATHRIAVAQGRITMLPATFALIEAGTAKKGDVLGIARIAGIQGAKKTSDLIPLCHPLALTRVAIDFVADEAINTPANGQNASTHKGHHLHRHGRNRRPNRRRDGSPDRRAGRPAHHLRHVQSRGPWHDHDRRAGAGEAWGEVGELYESVKGESVALMFTND